MNQLLGAGMFLVRWRNFFSKVIYSFVDLSLSKAKYHTALLQKAVILTFTRSLFPEISQGGHAACLELKTM